MSDTVLAGEDDVGFIKIHRSLRMSPAIAAVVDRLFDVSDLVALRANQVTSLHHRVLKSTLWRSLFQSRGSRGPSSTECKMNIRGTVRLISLALLATAMMPASTSASSIVLSQATLDWSGFTFSVDGGLVVDRIDYALAPFSLSFAETPIGGPQSAQGNVSIASSSSTQMGGAALASSSTNNGFLQSGSQSATFGESPTGHLKANGDASAFVDFWLYGHGSGTLTVSVPYTLQIQVNADQPPAGLFRDDFVSAAGSASLALGPGAGFADEQWFDSNVLAWLPTDPVVDGVLTKTGTLTVWRSLVNPTFGPLISLEGIVRTEAVAAVPEPGELELLGCGLAGALLGLRHRRGW